MSSPPGGLTSTIADLYTGGDYEKAKRVIRLVRDFDAQGIGASSPEPSSARTTADSPVAVFSDAPKEPSPSHPPTYLSKDYDKLYELLTAGGEALGRGHLNTSKISHAFDPDNGFVKVGDRDSSGREAGPTKEDGTHE